MKAPRYANKVIKLIQQANSLAENNRHTSIQSIHLFIGASLVKEGTLKEMYYLVEPCEVEFKRLIETLSPEPSSGVRIEAFSMPLSSHAYKIWSASMDIMKRYNQTFLNEGHLIKAFFSLLSEHPQLKQGMETFPKESIIQSVATARDLTVNLLNKDWSCEEDPNVEISIVQRIEKEGFLSWVEKHFGESWFETLRSAFESSSDTIPILKAEEKGNLVGFAAYDVYMKKKGIFGPMGVLPTTRHQGVGKRLLYAALRNMKEKGYMYAVLKEAGPIEFYERTCSAKLIPLEKIQ
ncbi:GNAT family N-acetyltransferase [Bacillus sp. AFS015802]|uniref:GNAT family N-acetyltransferase n=1 Tax=Bacillus sp. AFS015802 TaxID=2033486 RepID=UPI0015CF5AE0|nr:GNAT family N-acetyltransferase [Bacillus sp. AFS015802]